jgi:hypothetical protein
MSTAKIGERLGRALSIGAIGQHQDLAVPRHERAEHGFHRKGAAALHRHAFELTGAIARELQEPPAEVRGHGPEIHVPRAPVA